MEPHDWNFDSIPDHHLIACCYWEYARESIFLKKFKSRCVEANRNPQPLSQAFDLVGKDARTVLSIGTVANSFLLGFGFDPAAPAAPCNNVTVQPCNPLPTSGSHSDFGSRPSDFPSAPITGNFPAAWQSLSLAERDYRAQLATGALLPPLSGERAGVRGNYPSDPAVSPPPFQRATGPDALNAVLFLADSISSRAPSTSPSTPFPQSAPQPSTLNSQLSLGIHSQPTDEIALVQIQWGHFTDDQIIDSFRAWVKANRPATIRPVAARGHKLKDWRANLTRLAVMRLLNHFSAAQLLDAKSKELQSIWESKQFSGPTWLDVAKWHDARREARQIFHQLFPFLKKTDDPLSWPPSPRGPRGRGSG